MPIGKAHRRSGMPNVGLPNLVPVAVILDHLVAAELGHQHMPVGSHVDADADDVYRAHRELPKILACRSQALAHPATGDEEHLPVAQLPPPQDNIHWLNIRKDLVAISIELQQLTTGN